VANSYTFTALDRFPAGTVVGAYPVAGYLQSQLPPSGAPPVAASETQTMGATGATFTTLADGDYVFGASVSGTWRFVSGKVGSSTGNRELRGTKVGLIDLDFDPATQAELDSEAATRAAADPSSAEKSALTAFSGTVANVKDAAFGAKGGAKQVTDAAITSGQATLSSSSAAFVSAADVGKTVIVEGAGAAGAALQTTISSVAAGVATLAANASTTVTNARATYGFDDSAAFIAAYATHKPVHAPEDGYLLLSQIDDGTVARLYGAGPGRTFIYYRSSSTNVVVPTGTIGADVLLGANCAQYATSLTIADTTGLRAGDHLWLRSDAIWDNNAAAGVKKGEIVRIQSVTSSTVLQLAGPTADAYATADTAKVAKVTLLAGNLVDGITFVNTTPNQSGGGRALHFKRCSGEVRNCEFRYASGAAIVRENCSRFDVHHCQFPEGSVASPFGYAVQDTLSTQDCSVTNCTARGGHGGIYTCSSQSGEYGIQRFNTVRDNTAAFFYEMPYHCHGSSEGIAFIGNRAYSGAYSSTYPSVYGIYGKNCSVIVPDIQNCSGVAIRVDDYSDRASIIGGRIANQRAGSAQNAGGVWVRGPNATVKGLLIDGVRDPAAADATPTKNTDAAGVNLQRSGDDATIDNLVGINNGTYNIWCSAGDTPAPGAWRNVRTVNSGSGTTNKPAGLYSDGPQRVGGAIAPGWGGSEPLGSSAAAITAGRLYVARFIPPRDMPVTAIAFALAVNAGSNDNCDVAILDSTYTRVASAGGAVAGKLNAGAAGWISVNLTATYIMRQGKIYYLAFSSVTPFGSTAAQLLMPTTVDPMGDGFGTTAGLRDSGSLSGIGDTIGVGPHSGVVQNARIPFLKAIDS
jgi:hypothetical protein